MDKQPAAKPAKPAKPLNIRKLVADAVFDAAQLDSRSAREDLGPIEVVRDATNPYAFVVNREGKQFRVIVKELG